MANNRLIVQASGTAGVIYGAYDIFGTNAASETITVHDGTEAYFQGDFQRGGDNIKIKGMAGDFTAKIAGSNIALVSASDNMTVVIPIGTYGCEVIFEDRNGDLADFRTLRFTNGSVYLGSQIITSSISDVDPLPDVVYVEQKFDPIVISGAETGIRSVIDVQNVDGIGSYVVWTEALNGSTAHNMIKVSVVDGSGVVINQFNLQEIGSPLQADVDISDYGKISVSLIDSLGNVQFSKFNSDGSAIVQNLRIGSFVDIGYNRTTINSDFDKYGNSIVVWKTKVDNSDQLIGVIVDKGANLFNEFAITDQFFQVNPSNSRVSSLDGGGFVSVWTEFSGPRAVFGQILDEAGERVGVKFQISSGFNNTYASEVIDLEGYGFVVGYRTVIPTGEREENVLSFKIFDDLGNTLSQEIVVEYQNYISSIKMAPLSNGNFVVSWSERENSLISTAPVYSRIFDNKGNAISDKFVLIESSIVHRDADSYIGSSGENIVFGWSERNNSDYQIKFHELFLTQGSDLSNLSTMSFA